MALKTRIKESAEVDITPMIDIVFQLIIFFMVVMAIAVVYGVAIKFPPQGSQKTQQKKEKRLHVYVTRDQIDENHRLIREGILKLNGEEIVLSVSKDSTKRVAERQRGYDDLLYRMDRLLQEEGYKKDLLLIQGDMKTYHGKILRVIDQGKEVGIEGFSLIPPTR